MIVVKLIGGLGNQMFQYAFGRKLSIHHKTELFLDVTDLKNKDLNHTYRKFSLDKFNITSKIAPDSLIKGQYKDRNILERVLNKFPIPGKLKVISENKLHFDPEIRNACNHAYLNGYWQSPLYFNAIEDTIREDFKFSIPLSDSAKPFFSIINSSTAISLHIRRGDYVTNPETQSYHGVCDLEYYKKAIKVIQEKIVDPIFFIFSDDPEWVKQNFNLSDKMILVSQPGLTQFDDLQLMSSCKHAIIANSSFSWWGAWLINNKDKTVVAPLKWFANNTINTDNLFPISWVRI